MKSELKKVQVNGLQIYPFSSDEELIDYAIEKKKILIAINSKKIKNADAELKKLINENVGYIDGIGALLAVRHKGVKVAVKVPGCELWLKIIGKYYKTKTFYFVGGTQDVIENVIKKLSIDFPGIVIAGYRNGYFSSNEEKNLLEKDILDKKPDIIFVAMGSPAQELLMSEMHVMHSAVYQGLGGSFDVYTGKVQRAPSFFVFHCMEGIYRAIKEPQKRIKGVLSDVWFLIALYLGKY